MEEKELTMKDVFIVRATNPDNTTWIITVGDKLATNKQYETKEQAEAEIEAVNWDLVATMAKVICEVTLAEYKKTEEQKNETIETKISINNELKS